MEIIEEHSARFGTYFKRKLEEECAAACAKIEWRLTTAGARRKWYRLFPSTSDRQTISGAGLNDAFYLSGAPARASLEAAVNVSSASVPPPSWLMAKTRPALV